MSTMQLRRYLQQAIDELPPKRLASLADYIQFLTLSPIEKRVKVAKQSIASGKGVNWRKVRSDV